VVIVKIEEILQAKGGQAIHQVEFVTLTMRGQLCYTSFSTDRTAEFYPQFMKMAATLHLG